MFLTGQVTGGTNTASAFTLPTGYRPVENSSQTFASFDFTHGALAFVQVLSNGQVEVHSVSATGVIALDSAIFTVV